MTKRYTLYSFPGLHGNPRHYRFKFTAWLAALFTCGKVCELKDNKTGKYCPYRF